MTYVLTIFVPLLQINRYTQITCVKNKVAYTYAGTAEKEGNSQLEYDFSKELMLEYFRQCGDLLYDDNFSFMTVGYGGAADGS